MSRTDRDNRAHHAARLLADPHLIAAFDDMEADAVEALKNLDLDGSDGSSKGALEGIRKLQAIEELKATLRRASDGPRMHRLATAGNDK